MSILNFFHWYKTTASYNARSWFICSAVLFVTVMRSGLHYSYGEFLVDLREDFNKSSMTEGNWIGTLVMTTSMTFAPISVSFIRLFDSRGYQICIFGGILVCSISCMLSSLMESIHGLVFFYSVLQGIGTSITYMASSLILIDYFDKTHPYHVLGTSILYCGYPLGSVIFNPIYAALVDEYGWRIAFRIAAAILFITAFVTAPIFVSRYSNEEYEMMKQREAKGSLFIPVDKLKRPEVILWFSVNLTTFLGFYMPIVNLPTYMHDLGYQGAVTSLAVTVLSFSEIVAYIGASVMGDLFRGRLIVVNLISSLALSAIYFIWPSVDQAGWFMIIAMSTGSGFFLGFAIVYTFAETVDITRLPQDQAWGYTNTCSGLGLLLGPLLTGGIYDIRQSHDDVFYVTGCIFLFQLTLYCLLVYYVHRRDVKERPLFDASMVAGPDGSVYNEYTELQGSDDDVANKCIINNSNYGYDQRTLPGAAYNYSIEEQQPPQMMMAFDGDNSAYHQHHHNHHHSGTTDQALRHQRKNTASLSIERASVATTSTSIESPVASPSPTTGGSSPRMYTVNYQPNDSRMIYDR